VGGQQLQQYSRTGDPADLERSIAALERGVEQSQSGEPHLPLALNNLGLVLRIRYERTGDLADLERTIEVCERAAQQTQPSSPSLQEAL